MEPLAKVGSRFLLIVMVENRVISDLSNRSMNTSPLKPIYSTKPAHIITILGRVRTSAQAEPVDGICLDAKNRINGPIRCVV